jgi:hypothetical protein
LTLQGLVGTIRYTSISSHIAVEQSRKDDLECLGYILVYLAKGKLPWQGLPFTDEKVRIEKIGEIKQSTDAATLTEGLPQGFSTMVEYVSKLAFTDKPDYTYLMKLMTDTAEEEGLHLTSYKFEWEKSPEEIFALSTRTLKKPNPPAKDKPIDKDLFKKEIEAKAKKDQSPAGNFLAIPGNGGGVASNQKINTNRAIDLDQSSFQHNGSFFSNQVIEGSHSPIDSKGQNSMKRKLENAGELNPLEKDEHLKPPKLAYLEDEMKLISASSLGDYMEEIMDERMGPQGRIFVQQSGIKKYFLIKQQILGPEEIQRLTFPENKTGSGEAELVLSRSQHIWLIFG